MTTAESLNALADRVEREEPSNLLDQIIWQAIKTVPGTGGWKPYTTSLDAAVTLTDWCIAHLSEIGGDGLPMCVLTDGTQDATGFCLNSPTSGVTALARALTAAALRARAAILTDGTVPSRTA